MNYSRNIKKILAGKRILILWIMVEIIFSLAGFGIGVIVSGDGSSTKQPETIGLKEVFIFNKPDGKIFKGEMPSEWTNGDLKFRPINVPMEEDLQEFLFYLSAAYEIDFTFPMALIQKESNYQADVVSETNDYGLMQINEANHSYLKEQLGITDFLDPYDNVRAGMFILRKLFEKYETPEKVLMAYNLGEDGAKRLWEKGIFVTDYAQDVLLIQQQFKEQLEED